MTLQIRTDYLVKRYAPHTKGKPYQFFKLIGNARNQSRILQPIWDGTAKQISLERIRGIVAGLGIDPGDITLAEFFTFPGVRRSKEFQPQTAIGEITGITLPTAELAERAGITNPYQLWRACDFSHITIAISLWRGPKKVGLDNLEKLVRGLRLDPAKTALADLFR